MNEIENNIIYNFTKVEAILDFRRKMSRDDQELTDRNDTSVITNANITESNVIRDVVYGKIILQNDLF